MVDEPQRMSPELRERIATVLRSMDETTERLRRQRARRGRELMAKGYHFVNERTFTDGNHTIVLE